MLNKNLFLYVALLSALFLFYIITPILLAVFDYELGGYMLHGYVYSDPEISYILSLIDIFNELDFIILSHKILSRRENPSYFITITQSSFLCIFQQRSFYTSHTNLD